MQDTCENYEKTKFHFHARTYSNGICMQYQKTGGKRS